MPLNKIIEAFGLTDHHSAFLIGGGGKTSLMFALALELVREGKSVITTTSTRIHYPVPDQSACVLVGSWDSMQDGLKQGLSAAKHATIARDFLETDRSKLCGYTKSELDKIIDSQVADYLLVEADGSAGRSLKAHADFEPVLPDRAGLVIAVIGIDCIGQPVNDQHVHRAALFCETLDRRMNSIISCEDVSAILLHPGGYLRKVPEHAQVIAFISKAISPDAERQAKVLADVIRRGDTRGRITHILAGYVQEQQIHLI